MASPDGVVVRVEATGLCRSDHHAWAGHDDTVTLPHVPGHELVGTIESAGKDVKHFTVGDRVTTPFVCGCGTCRECAAGDSHVCPYQTQPGFTDPGSFAELVALRHADVNLVRVPDHLDAGAAAGLGCRFATAYRGLIHRAALTTGETVVVVGCGGVGLSAVMIAAAIGADVVAVDIASAALDLAAGFGAARTVNTAGLSDAAAGAAIAAAAPGGADVSVEALGREQTTAAAIRSLRPRGRHVQIGLFAEPPHIPMAHVIAGELSVFGSHGMPAHDYPELMALVESGRLRPGDLVTETITLDDVPDALASMDSRHGHGVTMIRP
ncbi:zinc-dependent alcohol dehydrogenase family protein [Spelaeicoccus albus]